MKLYYYLMIYSTSSPIYKQKCNNNDKKIHGNKYDYSLVEYKNAETEVKIICPNHGIFEQKPKNHFVSYGCSECSKINTKLSGKKKIKTTEQFIEDAKIIHGDKYDYS